MGQSNVRNRRPAQNGRKFAYNQMLGAFALQWPHREEILSEIASIMNFAVAVGTLALGMIPLAANPQECQGKMEIAVGGISGFADLANPENTRLLRSSACRV